MADIQSLSVRGIRSFGVDDKDEQRISFNKPLTLILGQNGCGKTTIIECLRYAITGQMPPGSRNECFVHDVKVNGTTEVKGQVKLKICNAKDKLIEVSRAMKVTAMPKKKTKFQTIDASLSIVDEDGNNKDMRTRCVDVDAYIHAELGVPKAILNSVVFCHQEDSSWPLDEGKKVKERFDEIFDADKYSDCFDRLKKIRKECVQKITMLEQEVAHLTEKKEDLNKKKLHVVNTETRISESELNISELSAKLKPIADKLSSIDALEKDLVTYETKKETAKARLEHAKREEEEMQTSIKTVFEGTSEELKANIDTYETTAKAKQKELDESYKQNTLFNKEEEKIANEKTSNEVKFNRLILLESQNQERIDKRNKMIVEIAKTAEVDVLPEINTDEEAAKGIDDLTAKVEILKKELDELKSQADNEEKNMQAFVNESRDSLSRHKQKISSKETELKSVAREIIKKDKDINVANETKNKLDELEKKITTAEEEYRQAENEINVEECQKEINEDEKGIEQHEQELKELDNKVTKLQKQSAKLKEREMIEESLKQKEKLYTILLNKHKASITQLLDSIPENGFTVAVNKVECEIHAEVEGMKKKRKIQEKEVTKLETERKHVREILNERRAELTKAEDQMYKACGTQSYDVALSKVSSNVEKLQDEQNILQSSMFIMAKYKTQIKDNNSCPLCNRGFASENDVMDLLRQLTTQVMNVPAKLEKTTEDLQRASAKKDELLGLKTINEKIISLKEKDIPQFEKRLNDIDKQIQSSNESLEELSMSLIEPEQKLNTAKQIQGEMPLLDRYNQEIKTTTKELETIKAQCSDLDTEMSLDEATAKQTDLRQKIATLRARIKSANTKIRQNNKKMQTLAEKKNKLKEEQLKMQKKIQEIVNLQEQRKQLEENRDKYEKELKELQDGIAALEAAVKEKEEAKSEVVKRNKDAIESKRTYINKVLSAFQAVKAMITEIKQHEERNIQREMDKIKEANNKLMEKQKQVMIDRDSLTKKIDALKDELAKQDEYKRNLKDNMKLRKAKVDIETYEKEIADVEEKMSGLNREELKEKGSLITEQTSLFRQRAQTEGSLKELKDRLKHAKTELLLAQSKNIEQKYREKNYELHISKAIDKDIRLYSVALEKCLMEFHKEKMENINLIIREMWRKIYRGNDIDYIEIKTEGSMTDNMERRKYDYRVVQCKNNVEIDMRGRCSAGQKVLACLIIRLALAETFSSRFGILALDEPTTNLDEENVRSLCQALGEIVQERMSQKNFMFIIITHDKEFIESLGNIDKVTYYYEVSRNEEGKSRIKKIKFT